MDGKVSDGKALGGKVLDGKVLDTHDVKTKDLGTAKGKHKDQDKVPLYNMTNTRTT